MSMRSELAESPTVVARLVTAAEPAIRAVADIVADRRPGTVVIAARGTSDHAAIYAQYVFGARNGLIVAPATPSLSSIYDSPPRFDGALVIGISQSGRSPDVVSVLADARAQGAPTVAITNDPRSELASSADVVIDLAAGPERAVAATKTYVAEVASIALLSAAMSDAGDAMTELRSLPSAMNETLAAEPEIERLAWARSTMPACAVLARGFQYATAREWALKLKELTGVIADPYSGADFQHGPIALVDEAFPVLAVATTGAALDGMAELLANVRERGGRLLTLSDDPRFGELGDAVRLPTVPEWLAPLVAILPAQLFAFHLAHARGLDPDSPTGLTKVTLTR
jgi:glucosamine--fructose-6-phosphate aminotransferase (isomerizing)